MGTRTGRRRRSANCGGVLVTIMQRYKAGPGSHGPSPAATSRAGNKPSQSFTHSARCPALCSSGVYTLVGAFNKEKALVGAFFGTVKLREGSLTALAGSPGPVV